MVFILKLEDYQIVKDGFVCRFEKIELFLLHQTKIKKAGLRNAFAVIDYFFV